jgi:hypothetical protein
MRCICCDDSLDGVDVDVYRCEYCGVELCGSCIDEHEEICGDNLDEDFDEDFDQEEEDEDERW